MAKRHRKCRFGVVKTGRRKGSCLKTKRPRKRRKGSLMGARRRRSRR
jgi:hypothetical protein